MRRGTPAVACVLLTLQVLSGCTSGSGDGAPPAPTASPDQGAGSRAEETRPEGSRLDLVRRSAGRAVEVVLSYDHRTLDAAEEAATSLMTEEYADAFRSSFDRVRTQAAEAEVSSRTVALDTGVVSATPDTVQVLVFADRTTESGDDRPSVSQIAPVVTLERADGAWRLSDIATGSTPGSAALTAREAAVVRHATSTARAYLTLDWKTIAEDLAGMQDLVAGELARQYAGGAEELVEAVRARRTVQQPEILAVGLSSVDARAAEALVSAVVTTTHQATGSEPTREGRRLRLHLERDGEGWRTTGLDVVD